MVSVRFQKRQPLGRAQDSESDMINQLWTTQCHANAQDMAHEKGLNRTPQRRRRLPRNWSLWSLRLAKYKRNSLSSHRSITVSGCTRLRRGLVGADTLPRQWAKLRAADSDVRQPSLQNQDQQASSWWDSPRGRGAGWAGDEKHLPRAWGGEEGKTGKARGEVSRFGLQKSSQLVERAHCQPVKLQFVARLTPGGPGPF